MSNTKPLLCDYQLFWHQHRERPPLRTSVQLGPYEYEVMNDDGSIEWRSSKGAAAMMDDAVKRAINDIGSQKITLFTTLGKPAT